MHPDVTTSAAQTGHLPLRPPGALMTWKTWLSAFFSCLSTFLIIIGWDYLNGEVPHFGAQRYLEFAILGVALSAGSVGFKELDRGGHRKARRNLLVLLIILLVGPLTFFFTRSRLHWEVIGWNIPDEYYFVPYFALFAAIFPLSLFLNRVKNRSTSQATIANAP